MNESRIIRLVKQFAAGHDQRVLAMKHVEKMLYDQGDSAVAFITRGLKSLGEQEMLRYTDIIELGRNFHHSSHYNPATIEQMTIIIAKSGTSWGAIAIAAEQAPQTPLQNETPRRRSSAEYQKRHGDPYTEEFVDLFKEAMRRDAIFASNLRKRQQAEHEDQQDPGRQRYTRATMPPTLTGTADIHYFGTLRDGNLIARFTMRGDKYRMISEIVAIGSDAEKISDYAEHSTEFTVAITTFNDSTKLPQARILV